MRNSIQYPSTQQWRWTETKEEEEILSEHTSTAIAFARQKHPHR
jgi:hypothetical protein